MNKFLGCLVLGLMCFLLVVGIIVQSKTVESSQTMVAKTTEEAELRDSILRYQEKYEIANNKLEASNKKMDKLLEEASSKGDNGADYSQKLKQYNALLGYTNLEGPGIEITVSDGGQNFVKGGISNFLVHDGDLIELVNELKAGGAEAISINDERIISNTAITCAGNIISINGKKVGSPFNIKAIGITENLYGTITVTNEYLKNMELEGVKVSIEKKDSINIKKHNGVHKFYFAK